MDSNRNQNIQINTFSGGMDSDTDVSVIPHDRYRSAINFRYLNNQSDSEHGKLTVIQGMDSHPIQLDEGEKVIETKGIDKYAIIFTKKLQNNSSTGYQICIYRVEINPVGAVRNYKKQLIFGPCSDWEFDGRLSIVGRIENVDNIKLYIADGIHQIIVLDIFPKTVQTSINNLLSSNDSITLPPEIQQITSGNLKSGVNQYSYQLYSRYKQSTNISPMTKQIPIVSRLGDYNYVGKLQGENTNMGVQLGIHIDDVNTYNTIRLYRIHYDKAATVPEVHIIYEGDTKEDFVFTDANDSHIGQITPEEYNQMSEFYIIPKAIESKDNYLFAAQVKEVSKAKSVFNDINTISLRFNKFGEACIMNYSDKVNNAAGINSSDVLKRFDELTLNSDCFNPINEVTKVMPDYSGANIYGLYNQDDQTLDISHQFTLPDENNIIYFGGSGKHIDWRFVITQICGDTSSVKEENKITTQSYYTTSGFRSYKIVRSTSDENFHKNKSSRGIQNIFKKYYINNKHEYVDAGFIENKEKYVGSTYNDPLIASDLKSLRRGELYRFGIIFTNSKGQKSPVKWITDIRVPDLYIQNFNTFALGGLDVDLAVNPIGVEFRLHDLDRYDIDSYEIVRCNRDSTSQTIVSQGVISRPIKNRYYDSTNKPAVAYTPISQVVTNRYIQSTQYSNFINQSDVLEAQDDTKLAQADNLQNIDLYQFASPEVTFNSEYVKDVLEKYQVQVQSLSYIYPNITSLYAANKPQSPSKNYIYSNGITLKTNYHKPGLYKDNDKAYTVYTASNMMIDNYKFQWHDNLPLGSEVIATVLTKDTLGDCVNYSINQLKYYKQSNEIIGIPHNIDSIENIADNDRNVFPAVYMQASNQCGINQYKFVKGPNWNEFAKKEGDKTTTIYTDNVTTIGDKQFCNWVSGMLYGASTRDLSLWQALFDARIDIFIRDAVAIGFYRFFGEFGPGATSLLLNINNDWLYNPTVNEDSGKARISQFADVVGARNQQCIYYDDNNTPSANIQNFMLNKNGDPSMDVKMFNAANPNNPLTDKVYQSTFLGTYICNIKKNVIPYGGYTKNNIENSTYYSYSNIKKYVKGQKNNITSFIGDTYICVFQYTPIHKFTFSEPKYFSTTFKVNYIPLETALNLYYEQGYTYSENPSIQRTWLQEQPGRVRDFGSQSIPQNVYNTAYSSQPILTPKFSHNSIITKQDQLFNFRCRFSDKKENNELVDSWTIFRAANYIDVDPNYGKITALKTFKNNLVFFQENAFGIFSVNERVAVTDNNNQQILLGSGGVLSRYDYVSTSNGMQDDTFACVTTATALYWTDLSRTELCQYVGGDRYEIISKTKNVNSFVSQSLNGVDKKYIKIVNDRVNNEVIFGMDDESSISFNEVAQLFYSKYAYPVTVDGINFNNTLLFNYKNSFVDSVSAWNEGRGSYLFEGFQLIFIINEQYNKVKVFDNAIIGTSGDTAQSIVIQFEDQDGNRSNYVERKDISNRYFDYRFSIPRTSNAKFGDRLKGKSVECCITKANSNSSKGDYYYIEYFITKFRFIWS